MSRHAFATCHASASTCIEWRRTRRTRRLPECAHSAHWAAHTECALETVAENTWISQVDTAHGQGYCATPPTGTNVHTCLHIQTPAELVNR